METVPSMRVIPPVLVLSDASASLVSFAFLGTSDSRERLSASSTEFLWLNEMCKCGKMCITKILMQHGPDTKGSGFYDPNAEC